MLNNDHCIPDNLKDNVIIEWYNEDNNLLSNNGEPNCIKNLDSVKENLLKIFNKINNKNIVRTKKIEPNCDNLCDCIINAITSKC